ncbi:MAG: hypothetical protein PVH88_09255 [Ignavibacteria bacterium]|jgi:hypothetical protein
MKINDSLLNVLNSLVIPIYIVLLVSSFLFVVSKFLKAIFEIDKFRNKTKSLVKDMDEAYKFMNETIHLFKHNQKKMSEEMQIISETMEKIKLRLESYLNLIEKNKNNKMEE